MLLVSGYDGVNFSVNSARETRLRLIRLGNKDLITYLLQLNL